MTSFGGPIKKYENRGSPEREKRSPNPKPIWAYRACLWHYSEIMTDSKDKNEKKSVPKNQPLMSVQKGVGDTIQQP